MLRFLRGVLYVLILIIVALGAFVTAMRMAIHGREVAVPKFVGLSVVQAEPLAAENGLQVANDSKYYSAQVAAGRILSQMPAPGTTVRRGFRVQVAESLGPQILTIPNVVGQSQRSAELNVRQRGLEPGGVALVALANAPKDTVLAQSPEANAQGVASPRVTLLVASDAEERSYVMPDLNGMTVAGASAIIARSGMKLAGVSPAAGSTPAGTSAIVVAHTPSAGQRVMPGGTVHLQVSRMTAGAGATHAKM